MEYFVRTWIPIIQASLGLLGLASLVFVWLSLKRTAKFNKVNTQHSLLSDLPSPELDEQFHTILEEVGLGLQDPITEDHAQDLLANIHKYIVIKNYINKYEHICAAINLGFVDDEYAYRVHSARILWINNKFSALIKKVREINKDNEVWAEIEKTSLKWVKSDYSEQGRKKGLLRYIKCFLSGK